ncbi:hypothetical protein ACNKHV_24145 [Shigella flexneri]
MRGERRGAPQNAEQMGISAAEELLITARAKSSLKSITETPRHDSLSPARLPLEKS